MQEVDMPVRPPGAIQMVVEAGLQTSRTEGAADIDIETGFKKEGADITVSA